MPLMISGILNLSLISLTVRQLQPFLIVAAGGARAALADIALGDVALAPAVMGGVDGETEGGVFGRDRAG